MNDVWDNSRVLPFLGVEAIAAGNLAKKSLQLVELKPSQVFSWSCFVDLVEEGHLFFSYQQLGFHNAKSHFMV